MTKQKSDTFRIGDLVVSPAHGVARLVAIEERVMYGSRIELLILHLDRDSLSLMIPTDKLASSGLRPLATPELAARAVSTMTGKARGKSGSWARRAQEYEKKIRSGDVILAAEVVRDLRSGVFNGCSYSERQIYEAAMTRVCKEVCAVLQRDPDQLRQEVEVPPKPKAA